MEKSTQYSELAITASRKTKEKNYWLNRLHGDLIENAFPYDYWENKGDKLKMRVVRFDLPGEISARALNLSKNSLLRLHVLLVALVSLLLDKYTGNKDIIVGVPINKQENPDDLINTVLAIRNQIEDQVTFKEFLRQVSHTIFEASENQNYPVHLLPEQLNIPFSQNSFPLFDTAVLVENIHDRKYIEHIPLNMIFSFVKVEGDIRGKVEYNGLRYRDSSVRQIIRHFIRLMGEAIFNPDSRVSQLEILSREEKERLLFDLNDTKTEIAFPLDKTIHGLFEARAAENPDKTAIIHHTCHLTYGEFNKRANQLARVLRSKGINKETIVGVMADRSIRMATGVLAVLKAGGIYLPIPPDFPPGRKKFILRHSGAAVLLTRQHLLEKNKNLLTHISSRDIILVDDETQYKGDQSNLEKVGVSHQDLSAYIIYIPGGASGPRGVIIEHPALINFLYSMYNHYNRDFGPGDRCLNFTDISIDVSILEFFLPLVFGSSLVILPAEKADNPGELAKSIIEEAISFTYIPPAFLKEVCAVLRKDGACMGLNKLLVGGEPIEDDVLKGYRELKQNPRIINGYGAVETTICTAFYTYNGPGYRQVKVPLGQALNNTKILLLNQKHHLSPPGTPGELCISGAGLSRGYLNQPELTAEKFDHDLLDYRDYHDEKLLRGRPDASRGGFLEKSPPGRRRQKTYQTGDRARWLEDGNIEFITTIGSQINLGGYRIEPGEIEKHLLDHKCIKKAVVVDMISNNQKYLCAYLVYHPPGAESKDIPTKPQLIDFLSVQLPANMIPQYFVQLEEVPLTAGGKLDRDALPNPQKQTRGEYVAPQNELEKTIARIWKEILNRDKVGINDNFFEIGGNSLGILKLRNRLNKELGKDIPDIKFLEYPTINSFHNYFQQELAGESSDTKEENEPDEMEDNGPNKLRLRSKLLEDEDFSV
jgi:amino acid adenylation domain-containing protein